jgi:hypothetical protein
MWEQAIFPGGRCWDQGKKRETNRTRIANSMIYWGLSHRRVFWEGPRWVIPTPQGGRRSLYHTRQMFTMASLDLPGLSQKILTCLMPFKRQFVCQWPTHNAWLPDLVTCLSCRVWDACQSPGRQNCSYKQDGWVTSRWISTASLSLILNIPMSI